MLQVSAFAAVVLFPHPSHHFGRFSGTFAYHRWRLSLNSSAERAVPLRRLGTAVSHAPVRIALVSLCLIRLLSPCFSLTVPISKVIRVCLPAQLPNLTHCRCAPYSNSCCSRMEVNRTKQLSTDVLWQCSAALVGSGIPRPALLTLWPQTSLHLSLSPGSSSPKRAGKNCCVSTSSMGPISSTTPGTSLRQPFIAYCLKNRSYQPLNKTRDIRTYMKGNKATQLPKIYTINKTAHKKKNQQGRQQENTINNYSRCSNKHQTTTTKTQRTKKPVSNNNRVTNYYTNQGRPQDKDQRIQTTLQEYTFICHPI